jgi:hypothetical protein
MAEEITVREVPVVQDIQIQERPIPEEPIGDQPEGLIEIQSDKLVEAQPEEPPIEMKTAPVRRSARIASGVQPPQRYALLTKVQETTKKLDNIKEKAKFEAIQREILQIFKELQAVEPVMKPDIPKDAEILRSQRASSDCLDCFLIYSVTLIQSCYCL